MDTVCLGEMRHGEDGRAYMLGLTQRHRGCVQKLTVYNRYNLAFV